LAIQNSYDNIIFPLNLQTITITLDVEGDGEGMEGTMVLFKKDANKMANSM